MRAVVFRSGLVAVGAMAVSVVVTVLASAWQGHVAPASALVLSAVCPLCIAWPTSAWSFRQKQKLERLNAALSKAHADLARTHRKLSRAHACLADRASRDAMTGLLNRESFLVTVELAHREGAAGHLLIIDADHFKTINDTHGHAAGDGALVAIAEAIARAAGPDVTVGRIGGEEFAACLPTGHDHDVAAVAESIRSEVEDVRFEGPSGRPIALSVSIGGAAFSQHCTFEDVLRRADERLYAAKRGGRNLAVTGTPGRPRVAA